MDHQPGARLKTTPVAHIYRTASTTSQGTGRLSTSLGTPSEGGNLDGLAQTREPSADISCQADPPLFPYVSQAVAGFRIAHNAQKGGIRLLRPSSCLWSLAVERAPNKPAVWRPICDSALVDGETKSQTPSALTESLSSTADGQALLPTYGSLSLSFRSGLP